LSVNVGEMAGYAVKNGISDGIKWPDLPEAVRAGITAMVKAAKRGDE
jgi:hypothetical protein